eukprot:TRINITY_DN20211_c0_g1::TRINITY_DN20211_c0_g1_i1::g.30398::m.30398 TRINITY_DN20211_c0_g1::TRINITY_DN20211_c0_g1_i1::g.30398  ORF type:complete len:373 (-),score=19.43,sp/Q8RXQ2/RBL18_ARATH/33.19/1e-30,UBA/PF00627.26/3.1e-06,Rhomboid/PF01694.17/0.00075,DER1/PF04511.10/0.0078,DUF1751/PF08551.5/0.012 TRINITY_DN20211_c0_g1_i1:361-1419(-)
MILSGSSGLAGAPTIKSMLIGTIGCSLFVSRLTIRGTLGLDLYHSFLRKGQIWRLFTHHFFINTPTEMLVMCFLLYHCRLFERQMGSYLFSSFLAIVISLSTIIQVALATILPPSVPLATGPYAIIFSAIALYLYEVPHTYRYRVYGFTFSDKIFVYGLATQIILSSYPSSLIPAFAGFLAGMLYRSEAIPLHRLRLPSPLVSLGSKYFVPLLEEPDVPVARRNQQNPQQQQHPHRARANMHPAAGAAAGPAARTRAQSGQGYDDVLIAPGAGSRWGRRPTPGRMDNQRADATPSGQQQQPPSSISAPIMIPEEAIQSVMALGFDRNRAVAALTMSGGDVPFAINQLLDGGL